MDESVREEMVNDLEDKIAVKHKQIKSTEGFGPLILGIFGLVLCIVGWFSSTWLLGVLIAVLAIFWGWGRSKTKAEYKTELRALENRLFTLKITK